MFLEHLKRGLEEHGLLAAGRRAYANNNFCAWLDIGSATNGHRQMVERAVLASGGYEAVGRTLFGDRRRAIEESYAAGDPAPIGSVTPAYVAVEAAASIIMETRGHGGAS